MTRDNSITAFPFGPATGPARQMAARPLASKRARRTPWPTARSLFAASLAAGLCALAAPAWSASVAFLATDLTDAAPDQDLWRIDYAVQGPLGTFEAVNLLFSPEAFSDITLLDNTRPEQLLVSPVVQPDPALASDGQLTITALDALDTSFQGAIGVSLVWKGTDSPGSQPFEWLDETFNVIATGSTTPVPEPGVAWLALGGLALTGACLRARQAMSS